VNTKLSVLSSRHTYSAGGRTKREREKEVHLPPESTMSSCYISNSSLIIIVVVCCCCCYYYCCCSALCSCYHRCISMCVPEISFFIVIRSCSRRVCGVFISIFNISPLFVLFPLLFRAVPRSYITRLHCNQPRRTTDDNSFRISLPASFSFSLRFLLLCLLLPAICLSV